MRTILKCRLSETAAGHIIGTEPGENSTGDRRALDNDAFCHDSNACYKEISMNIEFNQDGLCLKPKQVVKVRGGLGHSIVCDSGSVWLTQHGDPRDIILRAGDSFTFDRNGPALVQAFEQGAISIAQAEPQTRATGLAAFLRSALSSAGLPRGAVAV
jgi:hypothetical protein